MIKPSEEKYIAATSELASALQSTTVQRRLVKAKAVLDNDIERVVKLKAYHHLRQ